MNFLGYCAEAYTDFSAIYDENDDYEPIETSFFIELFTLKNPDKNQILDHANISSINETNFNRSLPTKIFIHGWKSAGEFKDALRKGSKLFTWLQDSWTCINLSFSPKS